MAYLKPIGRCCDAKGCTRPAVVALINRWRAEVGRFCRPHGTSRLAIQDRFEAMAFTPAPAAPNREPSR